MLMVIFGAGASFDSIPSYPPLKESPLDYRPPLANDLFANRSFMANVVEKFEHCQAIIPYLRNQEGGSIERILQQFQGA